MLKKQTTKKSKKTRKISDQNLSIAIDVASFLMEQKNKKISLTKEEKKQMSAIYKRINIPALVKQTEIRKSK